MILRLLLVITIAVAPAAAQAPPAVTDRVMAAVRAALAPALPFPASDALGSIPADGKSADPWMVKPLQPGDRSIEILANPLNEAHQRDAAEAMAQIGQSIEAAQRRADAQYEQALAEAKRTGRSQEVDGVSLNDEGPAGARIDAESHVIVEVALNDQPAPRVTADATPASVSRDEAGIERFHEARASVSVGALMIRLRGNEALIAELLRKGEWNSLLELRR